jgi:5'-3' exonuclease
VNVHLVDGTYELFRHFFVVPSAKDSDGREVGAVRAVLGSVLALIEGGATHLGVATDHVVESFRNRMWTRYKTGEGIDPALLAQFHPLEEALTAMGVVVWPMVEFEADDALASAAARAAADARVERVFVCTPDKDLAQAVVGRRVVQYDRRAGTIRGADDVVKKFGVPPESIPDYLGLVGDAADGYPGLPGWGAKTASAVLARYGHLEAIPASAAEWQVAVRGAAKLAATLVEYAELARLFRELATLRTDAPVSEAVEDLRWTGPRPEFFELCTRLDAGGLFRRAQHAAEKRT